MKKTIIQLLILITCFLGSHQVFAQKSKTTTGYAVKVDSFYFEKPATKNSTFGYTYKIDSLNYKPRNIVVKGFYNAEETDFSLTREIRLSDNSGSKTIPIEVNKGAFELLLSVNCNLSSGTLNVEIYDPKGTKRGNFSVKGSNDKSGWSETVGGTINKRFGSPMNGEWSLKFIAKKVSADILVQTKIK